MNEESIFHPESSISHPEAPISRIQDLGPVSVVEPTFGDFRLSVFPIKHNGTPISLPPGFELWSSTVQEMLARVPIQEGASDFYVTIDSRYFTQAGLLRREGVHVDGNFCADPSLAPKATWAGMLCVSPIAKSDNSHVTMGWKLPYDITIPIGQYISGTKGGILAACSWVGCTAWPGTYTGEILSGGELSSSPLGDAVLLPANRSIFMTSNTPHETLEVPMGVRRTLIRITLDCNYDNSVIR